MTDLGTFGPTSPLPIACVHRREEPGLTIMGRPAGRCAQHADRWGRPLPVLDDACRFCRHVPGAAERIVRSFDGQLKRLGRVLGEPPAGGLVELFPPLEGRKPPTTPTVWAVGILTAPRPDGADYLPATLASVAAAGWDDPIVFAEPNALVPDGVRCNRAPAVRGAWRNQHAALGDLAASQGLRDADAILLLEDDVELPPGLRAYLDESVLWPPEKRGKLAAINLFLTAEYAGGAIGWYAGPTWGGQALVFSRESALAYLADPSTRRHKFHADPRGDLHGDMALELFARRDLRQFWLARGPGGASLAAHRGAKSSIWAEKDAPLAGNRKERLWAGDLLAGRLFAPVPRRPAPVAAGEDLAARRLAVCRACPAHKWRGDERLGVSPACRCNLRPAGVVIDATTIGDPTLECPRRYWPKLAAAVGAA